MKLIAVFSFLLCLAEGEDLIKPRIANGQLARLGQFKYTVGLSLRDEAFCGGSLISEKWVLTAAHCLVEEESVAIYFGSLDREMGLTRFVRKTNMVLHPKYTKGKFAHDIALITFRAVTYSSNIGPIALPKAGYQLHFGAIAIASGWGNEATNGPLASHLSYTDVRIIPNKDCKKYYKPGNIDDEKVCASTTFGKTCYGDSGGPLVERSTQLLVGITSFSTYGCFTRDPDVFTRVTYYLDWIHQHTGI